MRLCSGLTFLFFLAELDVNENTKLVDLCVKEKHTIVREGCSKSLKNCLLTMDVDDLKGKDEAGWEAFVKGEGGPHGLVSGWLVEHNLEDYLKPTKKAKSGDGSGSRSGSSSSASPGN